MKTDDFDFELPPALIAQHPLRPRDASRLLVVDDTLEDDTFAQLPERLLPGDLLVFNDTRVLPTRLRGRRGAGKVEVTLHKAEDARTWRAFARPAKRLKAGDRIDFASDFYAVLVDKLDAGEIRLAFNCAGQALHKALERHGAMPLPPYIRRAEGADPKDRDDYQTVFARNDGAVAAPTAGLHFTPTLLDALSERSIRSTPLTLHVGAGTFLPVKSDRVEDHVMHAEWGELTEASVAAILETKAEGGRVVAVGTTALRLLESAAQESGEIAPFRGETDIFILPGYRFAVVDILLTNFHLPRSTLFMLVSAFAGTTRMKAAYRHAIEEGYRFYSYGDACLLSGEAAS